MKRIRRKNNTFLAIFLILLLPICSAIFDNDYHTKIPDVKNFGCQWYGGSVATMQCTCQENAKEIIVSKDSIPSFETTAIEFDNCPRVVFKKNSISDMRNLRNIILSNINSITFEEKSLTWYGYRDVNLEHIERFDLTIPSLKIKIFNSTVETISSEAFSGRIHEIFFEKTTIEHIEPFAFSNLLQTEKILFKDVEFRDIKLQAFKRFGTEFLHLDNVRANIIPSRAFANITVFKSFTINNCTFNTLYPSAFTVYNPKNFEVRNTKITELDGEAFAVTTRGDISFKNNVFVNIYDGAFLGLKLNKNEASSSEHTVTFDSNIFSYLTSQSLSVKEFVPKFLNLNLNVTCDCSSIDDNLKNSEFYTEINCLNSNIEYVTIRAFKSEKCSVISSNFTVIVITCVVILLVGLISIGLYIYYVKVYRCSKYGSEKQSKVNNNLSLIVPDGRTYRETELHVIVERTDLLTTDL